MESWKSKVESSASHCGLLTNDFESSAVLLELRKSSEESTAACEESSARHFQSSLAREGFHFVLFRSEKSKTEFLASDSESAAVLFRSITSSDEFEKSSGRS